MCWVKWSMVCQPRAKGGLSWRYEGSEFESFGEVEVEVVTK